MDLPVIEKEHKGGKGSNYPKMLSKVLVCACPEKIYSMQRIAKAARFLVGVVGLW